MVSAEPAPATLGTSRTAYGNHERCLYSPISSVVDNQHRPPCGKVRQHVESFSMLALHAADLYRSCTPALVGSRHHGNSGRKLVFSLQNTSPLTKSGLIEIGPANTYALSCQGGLWYCVVLYIQYLNQDCARCRPPDAFPAHLHEVFRACFGLHTSAISSTEQLRLKLRWIRGRTAAQFRPSPPALPYHFHALATPQLAF